MSWHESAAPKAAPATASDTLDDLRYLWSTATGYAISIERCTKQGWTARYAFELRQTLDCLGQCIESLERALSGGAP